MPSKIDSVLESVGAFGQGFLGILKILGLYQFLQITLSSLGSFFGASQFLIVVFHSITPQFRCSVPSLGDNDTYRIQSDWHNVTINQWIPRNNEGDMETCKIYTSINQSETEECSQWVFDNTQQYWGTTLNMKFGLVCSNTGVETAVKVCFTTGAAAGAFTVGALSDRLGRRPSLIGCLIVGGVVSTVSMFSPHIIMYAVSRFICAMCYVLCRSHPDYTSMEIVGPSRRTWAIAYKSIFWPFGTMFLSLLAYFIQDWNLLQLAISLGPLLCGLLFIFTLNETPHYLVAHNKYEETEKLLMSIAKMNGRKLPDGVMESLKEDEEEALTEKVKEIFKAPVLLKRFAVFLYLWFIAGLGFYGLSFNVGNLTGSIYINNILSGLADLPAFIIILLSAKLGRKISATISLFLGAATLISAAFMSAYLHEDYSWLLITVAMIGKFAVSTLFMFNYFWSSELFPTTVRTSLIGVCSVSARIGSTLSPFIVDLYKYVSTLFAAGLGPLIFGATMLIGGFLTFYLPETNNKKIPVTISEANTFVIRNRNKSIDDSNEEKISSAL